MTSSRPWSLTKVRVWPPPRVSVVARYPFLTGASLLPVVSSLIFKQELPVWLDGIIYVTAIAAAVVVATNSSALDTYLQ